MESAKQVVVTVYSNKFNSGLSTSTNVQPNKYISPIIKNSIQYNSSDISRIFSNLSDVIPQDGFQGFYVNKLKELGVDKFVELANKARRGSDTPQKLFCWMLTHPQLVN